MAAAIGILDKAEAESDEADAHARGRGFAAEAERDSGQPLDRYGIAIDGCRSALELLDPVADPTLFSSKGKRTAPDLKKGLSSILEQASAGVERIKKAEAALNAGESSAEALGVADSAIGSADAAQSFLDEIAPALGDVSSLGEEKLVPLRDRISMQRRTLADSKAALERAKSEQPKDKGSTLANGSTFANANGSTFANANGSTFANANGSTFANDKLDFARRRLDTADASLTAAYHTVDREIRDPAERRAERAQALRWTLLHEPREYLSVRAYLPFMFSAGGQGIEGSPFEGKASLEGAFAFGDGGVWVRSQGELASTDLEPGESGGDELACTQSFDFGIWGKTLFFAGYHLGLAAPRRRRVPPQVRGGGAGLRRGIRARRGPRAFPPRRLAAFAELRAALLDAGFHPHGMSLTRDSTRNSGWARSPSSRPRSPSASTSCPTRIPFLGMSPCFAGRSSWACACPRPSPSA